MGSTLKNILITGLPGVGKTTIVKRLAEKVQDLHPAGFYTLEIRVKGHRQGFELVSLDGKREALSHVNFRSPHRVGKYKVDVGRFEDFLASISFRDPFVGLIIIDEIGKMECFSEKFRRLLIELLDSEKWVIATIALQGTGLIDEVKRRDDVKIYEVTEKNRDSIVSLILDESGWRTAG